MRRSQAVSMGLMLLGAMAFQVSSGGDWGDIAFGETSNATVEVVQEAQGEKVALTFKVVPQNNLVVNDEGPWALNLAPSQDFAKKIEKVKYTKSDFDFKIPGIKIAIPTPEKAQEDLEYSLTAFICTADKTRCYREVIKAKHVVKKTS
jgi:hypothetical protein